ncbi:MAG: MarR family winged helix-turn-helix transcriptional regulator [Syntrophomonadaceae bacterium]|nr:MarR family winged helix-turn-helix transcriptional regulator [Syntrophomonadaceae bacterium]
MLVSNEAASELRDLLFSFLGLFHEKFIYRFRKSNESHSEMKKNHIKIISFLYRDDSLTSTEIAKMLDLEKGSVTTLIDQLAELGLVSRCAAPHDRRKSLLVLTDLGRSEMEDIIGNELKVINEMFHNHKTDDIQDFVNSLRHVIEFLNKL